MKINKYMLNILLSLMIFLTVADACAEQSTSSSSKKQKKSTPTHTDDALILESEIF